VHVANTSNVGGRGLLRCAHHVWSCRSLAMAGSDISIRSQLGAAAQNCFLGDQKQVHFPTTDSSVVLTSVLNPKRDHPNRDKKQAPLFPLIFSSMEINPSRDYPNSLDGPVVHVRELTHRHMCARNVETYRRRIGHEATEGRGRRNSPRAAAGNLAPSHARTDPTV
jgi:hypothetical protein